MSTYREVRHCRCGGGLIATSNSREAVAMAAAAFDLVHQGDGHGPTTPGIAARALRMGEVAAVTEGEA